MDAQEIENLKESGLKNCMYSILVVIFSLIINWVFTMSKLI